MALSKCVINRVISDYDSRLYYVLIRSKSSYLIFLSIRDLVLEPSLASTEIAVSVLRISSANCHAKFPFKLHSTIV